MKVIETEYKGYRFRSRLEAIWAVFFDACGVKWEYEPEGFDLGDGLYYLPDFLLHDVYLNHGGDGTARYFGDLWIEIKGIMNETDAKKIIKFANLRCDENNFILGVENPILVVTNIPDGEDIGYLEEYAFDLAYEGNEPYPFNFELIDGDYFGAFPCINKQGHFTLVGHDGNYTADADDEKTENAYRLARQARFEHR